MTDKDNVSMATVQMKPDYAASEVYSTASEAPPAYKRQSNSVKIAKITAFTIIVSSFVLGSFILASSYLQAKASCDQVQALDSVLEKELMLETLQQVNKELPRAEALMGKESNDEMDLQNLDVKEEAPMKKVNMSKNKVIPLVVAEEEANDNDNSYSDSEEAEELQKFPGKLPLELDLSDLAAALLQNNKKSRMNCVVERKHAEEIVDSPAKTVQLPFGMNLTTDPKKARITGERISIFCDGGDDDNNNREQEQSRKHNREEESDDNDDDVEPLRPMFFPLQRMPIPFGRMPEQFPLTHMPQRMMPPMQQQSQPQQPFIRQMPPPFQQLPMRPPMPPQVMQAPHPEARHNPMMEPQQQTVRIHVQQIPFREIHVADDVPMQIQPQRQEMPQFQIQRLPLGLALQRAGITADDLRNIQRMAEGRITDELRRLAAEEAAESAESNNSQNSSEENDSAADSAPIEPEQREQEPPQQPEPSQPQEQPEPQPEVKQIRIRLTPADIERPQRLILQQQLPEQPRDTMSPPMLMQDQPPQYGRVTFGRSLAQPISIPVRMMQAQAEEAVAEAERPHFVQPRSV